MHFSASDFYSLYQPSRCDLRVYLKTTELAETPPGPYAEMLRRLGERHEASVLKTFPKITNLAAYPVSIRAEKTLAAIAQQAQVLYHPFFQVQIPLAGQVCEIVGEPDLLVLTPDGYTVMDIKISRRISEKDHPEILRQVELYGWLFEKATGQAPSCLEVIMGQGQAEGIAYDQGQLALETAAEIIRLRQLPSEPYSPIGWTKCLGCGFRGYCWPRAEKQKDVALVADLDLGLATTLKNDGIDTISGFLRQFTPETLENYLRPWGNGTQKVGKKAQGILLNARAWDTQQEILLQKPQIPKKANYVMFDLEGLPPQLDELQKIYLWGLQVVGTSPAPYAPAVADFGTDGDRAGWERFLAQASAILAIHGNIPFVHWAAYEKTNIKLYRERFGDPAGIAERVLSLCLDLLPITKAALALPLPSYSLKVVEKYIGYERSMEEYGGDWSMAKYIEAVETEDETERRALMEEILKYNREDLEAMWAVMRWLLDK